MLPGSRTDIHDVIRRQHGILVMLYHDQRIAEIAQMLQSGKQLVVVPLVEPDAGLIQDICHSDQSGTDLGRKPDPLRLTAGKRPRGAGKRQVIQPHIHQEFDPCPDFF